MATRIGAGAGQSHQREDPADPENPPAYDPQANGGAERGVQEVKGHQNATKLGL